MHVDKDTVHNSQKMETAQMPIGRWMDKKSVIYTFNGILFSHKNEWGTDTCCNVDDPLRQYAMRTKPDTNITFWWCYYCIKNRHSHRDWIQISGFQVLGVGKMGKTVQWVSGFTLEW